MGYTPWSCKESDMTELLTQHWEVILLVDAFFIFLCGECKLHILLSHHLFTPPPKDILNYLFILDFPSDSVKNLPAMQETWVRKIPWRRA